MHSVEHFNCSPSPLDKSLLISAAVCNFCACMQMLLSLFDDLLSSDRLEEWRDLQQVKHCSTSRSDGYIWGWQIHKLYDIVGRRQGLELSE